MRRGLSTLTRPDRPTSISTDMEPSGFGHVEAEDFTELVGEDLGMRHTESGFGSQPPQLQRRSAASPEIERATNGVGC